ncbi:MAG: DUF951 domain-containing protein [Synergistaceae bacterium]|jgi:hypothetical protein|nr:DUF951 domain-containing protein [Synergistaceae bacterium]
MFNEPFKPGIIVKLRKPHACGSDRWRIVLVGALLELECLGCGKRQAFDPLDLRRLVRSREGRP